VSVLAGLVAYNIALVFAGPALLTRLTRSGHAPRAAVLVWLSAIASAVSTWIAIVVFVTVDVVAHWGHPTSFVASCLRFLCDVASGAAGLVPQLAVAAALLALSAVVVVFAVRLARAILRLRRHARDHGAAIRMVGRRMAGQDVYVVDAAERAAYCVSGRPSTIVVTSSAVAALGERELGAVIAHERAHVAGHHLLIVTVLRGLAAAMPRVELISRGADEVGRLLEMCADDAAVRRHGERALLDGLLVLVGAAPAHALGAADVAALHRARRLAAPATQRARWRAKVSLATACMSSGRDRQR
jgi:Zn-dependent protease with chaperone function